MISRLFTALAVAAALSVPGLAQAAEKYAFDTKGQHAFIQFRIQHLGFSWLYGRFNDFDGSFTYDPENPANSKVEVTVDTASVDTNHAERDKHLREEDFLYVKEYPQARFVSKSYEPNGDNTGTLVGDLTLRGVTKEIELEMKQVGAGDDPWGGFRRGFAGTTELTLADFGIPYDLGPAARTVELMISVEGVRQ